MENYKYYPLPQPEELTNREKDGAMGGYLMMFAAMFAGLPLPIINLIAAIAYYFVSKKKSRFIHFHSLQSLLSQIPTTLMNWVAIFWTLQIFLFNNYELNEYYYAYIIFIVVMNIAYFILSIVAAIRAKKGEFYYFVFFGSLAYNIVYKKTNTTQYKNELGLDAAFSRAKNNPPF